MACQRALPQPSQPAPASTAHVIYVPLVTGPQVKKGLATHHPDLCNADLVGAAWQYNWTGTVATCAGVESVPMIYNEAHLYGIRDGRYGLELASDVILGFNEPDLAEQANMSPERGAELWRVLEAMCPQQRLISPAVVVDMAWLARFREAYIRAYGQPPRLHGLAMHCYANTVAGCQHKARIILGYARTWGIDEVWVTEFMFWGPGAEERMEEFVAWMEAEPLIARYAWFPCTLAGDEEWLRLVSAEDRERYMAYQLILSDGTLTSTGKLYATLGEP